MRNRLSWGALLLAGLSGMLVSCTSSPSLTSIIVSPNTMTFGGSGLTTQLTATGYYTHPNHPPITKDITDQVNWASATPQCVTVSSTGLITSGGNVCSNIAITASASGFNGTIAGTMTVNVTQSGSGGGNPNADISTISIIPGSQSVTSPGQTGQFLAIGTTSGGATVSLTGSAVWTSSSPSVATVSKSGVATAVSAGTTTITAVYTNADLSVATGTATFTVMGGATSESVTALTIIPGSQSVAVSQTGQFIALGTLGSTGLDNDVTKSASLKWASSIPTVATVNEGLVTGVSAGTTTITGQWTNPDGSVVTQSATVNVSATAAPEPLLSVNVVPGSITVSNKGMTGQFLAFGTFSTTPTVRDLTDQVTWISALPEVASIDSNGVTGEIGGLATAQGYTGQSDIYALAKNPDGTVVLSNAVTFSCADQAGICDQGIAHPQLATLTVYNAGENTTTWLVTAPSDTNTPNLIHCGPGWTGSGGSVCTGTYETGSTVTLTESPTGSGFGGWSSGDGAPGVGCTPASGKTLQNSPTCTVTLQGNTSIGAIFY